MGLSARKSQDRCHSRRHPTSQPRKGLGALLSRWKPLCKDRLFRGTRLTSSVLPERRVL